MLPFTYSRVSSVDNGIEAIQQRGAKYLAGGTNLVDLMKMGVEQPAALLDITRLPLAAIEESDGGVRIGATARNSTVANHLLIRQRYPVLAEALLAGASPQIRNVATIGGNLLQRTRCFYFYDPSYRECNKRVSGSGCAAIHGYNRIHAILGGSGQCVATHPSDMAVALAALDPVIFVRGPQGERTIPFAAFYRLPGETPHIETELMPGELITAIELPPPIEGQGRYLKARDRNSYAFALVSAAAILSLDADTRILNARIALGGVAPKPWRVAEAERLLVGKYPADSSFGDAADVLIQGAKALRYNAFKVELARRITVRALSAAAGS
jgi:xanthine dehydrogenase YagS FAD-binding subunit